MQKNSRNKRNKNNNSRSKVTSTHYDVIEEYNDQNNIKPKKKVVKQEEKKEEVKVEKKKSRAKKETKHNKKLIAFTAFVLVAYFFYAMIAIIIKPSNTATVYQGTLSKDEKNIAYIVREETIITNEEHKDKTIEKIKIEGEKVAKDTNIFRYYSNNEIELGIKICEIDTKIQKIIADKTYFSNDIKSLQEQIDEKTQKMGIITDTQELASLKRSIKESVSKKLKLIAEVEDSEELRTLITEREKLENQKLGNTLYVKAGTSGIMSYRIDNLGNELRPDNLNELTKEKLEGLNLRTGQVIGLSNTTGKIVNNYYSYLIFNSDSEESKTVEKGKNIKIRLFGNEEIKAEVANIIEENDGSRTIALRIENCVEKLISYRKISFDVIWWSESGYRIPENTIVTKNDISYVVRNRDGYLNSIPVKVLKTYEGNAIVTNYTNEELTTLGFSKEKINSFKKLVIYDELVVNPSVDLLLQ